MQHSIQNIGERYEEFSRMRKEKTPFNSNDFFNFAKENKKKYSIIESGDDLLVSTWHSDALINDYKKTKNIE